MWFAMHPGAGNRTEKDAFGSRKYSVRKGERQDE